MKRNQPSAPLPLGRICAAFSLLGSWQENKSMLLGIVVVVAAVLALFFWLFRRRRHDSTSDSLLDAPGAPAPAVNVDAAVPPASDGIMTQIEDMPHGDDLPPSKPSPGLYGKIEVRIGGQMISSYLITDHPLSVGRDPAQASVIIQEPIVSKLHCQIYARGGQVFVKDLNSTNGVYMNDKKVSECELEEGDEIFLGRKGTIRIVYHR